MTNTTKHTEQDGSEPEKSDKDFHRMARAMGKRLRELAAIPGMEKQYDKELIAMAADIYALGYRDVQKLIAAEKQKAALAARLDEAQTLKHEVDGAFEYETDFWSDVFDERIAELQAQSPHSGERK